jgi:hypothetical protein
VQVITGILALLIGIVALFAADAVGLDDYVAPWFADLLALSVMFVLIAALGATSKRHRPHSP